MNQEMELSLVEGTPIIYNQSGNLPPLVEELILIDEMLFDDIPLSKMGRKFKNEIVKLTNLIF